jgi:hypothetical protein
MDQKLLNALNNIGMALEELVDALNSKSEAKSDTATTMVSGNFGEQLESISAQIKDIKTDTEKILKNQETLLGISKEKEDKKTKGIEEAGDEKKGSAIKKGLGTIMLIAVAVLAIGMAFKLVGEVNILSVIAIALAITIIATAFEKVANLGISLKDAAIASLTLVMISVALTLSSIALSFIQPVSALKLLTAILIAGAFVVLSPAIQRMIWTFRDMSWTEIGKAAIGLVFVMPAIALGIALASHAFGLIKPITFVQFFSAIMIAAVFAVVSYGIRNMLRAFEGVPIADLAKSIIFLPLILPAIALGLALASHAFGLIKPITLVQFFSAVMIGLVFVVLAFGLKKIIGAFKDISPETAVVAGFMIPILFTAMSVAIWASSQLLSKVEPVTFVQFLTSVAISIVFLVLAYAISPLVKMIGGMKWEDTLKLPVLFTIMSLSIMLSSHILSKTADISLEMLLKIAILGVTLAVVSAIMAVTIKILSKLSIKELLIGSAAILGISVIIMTTSHILAAGNYGNYPKLGWILGVGVSLVTFGLAAFTLGLAVFGPQALIFAAGLGAILVVAGTITAVSHILANGKYDNPGMLKWALATSLLYATFTPIILILGAVGLASSVLSFFGADPFKKAQEMIVQIAETIVEVSHILPKGNYKGGPTKEWAEGISIALGAFSPIYAMLMKNGVMKIFGGGGVGPEDFTSAIKTVSQGIVDAAIFFADAKNAGVWGAHPTKEWAEGVGTAIGAFAPVFEVLTGQSWLSKSVSPEDMKKAILTISEGIVSAAKFFADNTTTFEEGKYPSKNWGEGVGAALGAFAPVFDMLMEKSGFWKSGDSVINDMIRGITGISSAVVQVATMFTLSSDKKIFEYYPDSKWSQSVRTAMEKFVGLTNYLENNKKAPFWVATNTASKLVKMAKILYDGEKFFSNTIDPGYMKSVSQNMLDFNELVKKLAESEDSSLLSKLGNNLLGTDPIMQIAKRMVTLAEGYDKLATSLIKLGTAMKTLNISDIRMLGGLTREITKTGDIKTNISDQKPGEMVATKSMSNISPIGNILNTDKQIGKKSIEDKMDEVIRLLTNIDKSAESINSFMMENSDSSPSGPPIAGNKSGGSSWKSFFGG